MSNFINIIKAEIATMTNKNYDSIVITASLKKIVQRHAGPQLNVNAINFDWQIDANVADLTAGSLLLVKPEDIELTYHNLYTYVTFHGICIPYWEWIYEEKGNTCILI